MTYGLDGEYVVHTYVFTNDVDSTYNIEAHPFVYVNAHKTNTKAVYEIPHRVSILPILTTYFCKSAVRREGSVTA